jgi:hypothetical protein
VDTETPHQEETGSELSQMMGDWTDASHTGTQQERRHQFVDRKAAGAATKVITPDVYYKSSVTPEATRI